MVHLFATQDLAAVLTKNTPDYLGAYFDYAETSQVYATNMIEMNSHETFLFFPVGILKLAQITSKSVQEKVLNHFTIPVDV